MADLRTTFAGIKSPNPFWLASAPPTDKAYNVARALQAGFDHLLVRGDVLARDLLERALIARHGDMRIGLRVAMAGKMLGDGRHAALRESLHQASAQRADGGGIEVQRAIADHRAAAIVEIEHRREAEVDAVGAELGRDDVADRAGGLFGEITVAIPQSSERAHRRNGGEALAKALHAPALVIDAHRQRRLAQPLDVRGERGELFRVFVVASEENHRPRCRVANALPVLVGQHRAEDVNHQGPGLQPYFAHSRMTVAKATPRSSDSETCAEVTPFASR